MFEYSLQNLCIKFTQTKEKLSLLPLNFLKSYWHLK